jgi:hypothetical protein
VVGLAVSLAVHCIVLSFTGFASIRLLPSQISNPLPMLMVDLEHNQRQTPGEHTNKNAPHETTMSSVLDGKAEQADTQRRGEAKENAASNSPETAANVSVTGLFPGPWYYAARYLHRRPTPLKPIQPVYPPNAKHLSGQVILLLLINERGAVDSYQIIESQPPGHFDDPVIEAFTHEIYAPGLITGYPVKSQLLVEIVFEPGALPEANILPDLTQFKIKAAPVPSAKQN